MHDKAWINPKNISISQMRKREVKWHDLELLSLFSHYVVSESLRPHGLQHARLLCSSPTPRACSPSCPLSQWGHPTISSSFVPFSSCLQFFPASGSFLRNQFFTSGGQSIRAWASVLPMNIQDWFPLGWTDWISLQSKGLSRVFSNSTVLGLSNPSLRSTKTYVHKHSPHHSLYQNYFQKTKQIYVY